MDCDDWDISKILIFFYKYDRTLTYGVCFMTIALYHWGTLIDLWCMWDLKPLNLLIEDNKLFPIDLIGIKLSNFDNSWKY